MVLLAITSSLHFLFDEVSKTKKFNYNIEDMSIKRLKTFNSFERFKIRIKIIKHTSVDGLGLTMTFPI